MRILLATIALWAAPAWAEMEFLGTYIWADPNEQFGGLSALEVLNDGQQLLALSDRGWAFEGDIKRNGDVIDSIEVTNSSWLNERRTGAYNDVEGLAIGSDGWIYVSYEGRARVARFETIDGRGGLLPYPPNYQAQRSNYGLEALAITPSGALLTLPERSGRADRPFPVYWLEDREWSQPFTLPRHGPFLPAGADVGPDNMLYLLERDFTGIGFRTRIRRFDLNGQSEEILLETRTGTHGNLEGISVWDDGVGLRITMIADDNFKWFQQNEVVEYRLTE